MADKKTGRLTWQNGDNHTVCVTCNKFIKMGVNESPHNRQCKYCKEDSRMSKEHNYFQHLQSMSIEERIELIEKQLYQMNGEQY